MEYEAGADVIKFFPAGRLGSSYIKALSAPLAPHFGHVPKGGVDMDNAADF